MSFVKAHLQAYLLLSTIVLGHELSAPVLAQDGRKIASIGPAPAANAAATSQSLTAPQTLDLPRLVGLPIVVQGRLKPLPNGRIGITVNEPHSEQISIDALPCPERGDLAFELLVTDQEQSVKRPKYKKHGQSNWLAADARLKKLDHLIEQYQLGEMVELRGKLCHLTTSIRGNVQPSIHYPKLPDSHYFFSVDDLIVSRKK